MLINTEDQRPIFIQIAEGIEDAILTGAILRKAKFLHHRDIHCL